MARSLTLRDVPEPVVRALSRRARRNRRSMQKEILAILEGAVPDRDSLAAQIAALRSRQPGRMTLRQIRRAIDDGRP